MWAVSNSIFLQSLQVSRHERRLSQIDAINEMPLYPTEQVTENFQYFFFYHVWNGKIAQVWITTWRIRFHMCLYLVIKNKTSITKENVSTQSNHFNFFVNICFPDFVGWKYCSNRILFIRRYFEGICQYFFIVVFVLILNVSYFIIFFSFVLSTDTLALPKLNLQFLTLHDYLLRNLNLFRLESTCMNIRFHCF